MLKYRLVNYFDVWGNDKDGYEVNNLCEEGFIEVDENAKNEDLVKALKEFGFLASHVRMNMLDIWNDYEFIEFS
jgi:hypothetical protein